MQAFVRGVVARRQLQAASAVYTLVQACVRETRATDEASCHVAASTAVRVKAAATVVVQALWRGVMSREALFRKTIAAVIMQS